MDGLDIEVVNDEKVCIIAAPVVKDDGKTKIGRLGFLFSDLVLIAKRGETALIAAFYGQVVTGTILTKHVFQGLRRSMLTDADHDADKNIWAYSRKPAIDWMWDGDPHSGGLILVEPPTRNSVFVVLVSPNVKHREKFPTIDGWIDAWSWVHEDKGLPEAPVGWVDRYQEKLWTK